MISCASLLLTATPSLAVESKLLILAFILFTFGAERVFSVRATERIAIRITPIPIHAAPVQVLVLGEMPDTRTITTTSAAGNVVM